MVDALNIFDAGSRNEASDVAALTEALRQRDNNSFVSQMPTAPERYGSLLYGRPFRMYVEISKAVSSSDGRWLVTGPISTPSKDHEKQVVEKAGIVRGLKTWVKLGCHVDYNHRFKHTADMDDIIGKGVDLKEVNGVPFLTTELLKRKPKAEKLWRHLCAGGKCGYSIDGTATAHPADPNRIIDTVIHLITIAPQPMNYDCNSMKIGAIGDLFGGKAKPLSGGPMEISKALVAGAAEFTDWSPIDIAFVEQIAKGLDISKGYRQASLDFAGPEASHQPLHGQAPLPGPAPEVIRPDEKIFRHVNNEYKTAMNNTDMSSSRDRGHLSGMMHHMFNVGQHGSPSEIMGRSDYHLAAAKGMAKAGIISPEHDQGFAAGAEHMARSYRDYFRQNGIRIQAKKALLTGDGVVQTGDQGGRALRPQCMGAGPLDRRRVIPGIAESVLEIDLDGKPARGGAHSGKTASKAFGAGPVRVKASKAEVHYRDGDDAKCQDCRNFSDDRCSRVKGEIDPTYTCNLFQWKARSTGGISKGFAHPLVIVMDSPSRTAGGQIEIRR